MGLPLSSPVQNKLLWRKGNEVVRVGAVTMQGWRQYNDDTFSVELNSPKHPKSNFFAIFDGHGKPKSKISEYLTKGFFDKITQVKNPHDKILLTKAILKIDKKVLEIDPESGSAAIFCIIDKPNSNDYLITVGNIGNCRAILFKYPLHPKFLIVELSQNHLADAKGEAERIERVGGKIVNGRINGEFLLSRSLGDEAYKRPTTFAPEFQMVSPIPDITSELGMAGDLVFISSDGIFENNIFTTDTLCHFILDKLAQTNDLALILADLMDQCILRGSKDNLTAILIKLGDGKDYHQEKSEFIPGPFECYLSGDKRSDSFVSSYTADVEKAGYTVGKAMALYRILDSPIDWVSFHKKTEVQIKEHLMIPPNFSLKDPLPDPVFFELPPRLLSFIMSSIDTNMRINSKNGVLLETVNAQKNKKNKKSFPRLTPLDFSEEKSLTTRSSPVTTSTLFPSPDANSEHFSEVTTPRFFCVTEESHSPTTTSRDNGSNHSKKEPKSPLGSSDGQMRSLTGQAKKPPSQKGSPTALFKSDVITITETIRSSPSLYTDNSNPAHKPKHIEVRNSKHRKSTGQLESSSEITSPRVKPSSPPQTVPSSSMDERNEKALTKVKYLREKHADIVEEDGNDIDGILLRSKSAENLHMEGKKKIKQSQIGGKKTTKTAAKTESRSSRNSSRHPRETTKLSSRSPPSSSSSSSVNVTTSTAAVPPPVITDYDLKSSSSITTSFANRRHKTDIQPNPDLFKTVLEKYSKKEFGLSTSEKTSPIGREGILGKSEKKSEKKTTID